MTLIAMMMINNKFTQDEKVSYSDNTIVKNWPNSGGYKSHR